MDNNPSSPAVANNYASFSSVIQDYLKAIWNFTENKPQKITTSMLAERLGVANSTVSENLKKISQKNLVNYTPYTGVTLTDAGEKLALFMVRRHRILETYLFTFLDYGLEEVHSEAEVLEHAISDKLIDCMNRKLKEPLYDPHGDPIPKKTGELPPIKGELLATVPPKQNMQITRIIDTNQQIINYLQTVGLQLGMKIRIQSKDDINQIITLQIQKSGQTITLGTRVAETIWVEKIS